MNKVFFQLVDTLEMGGTERMSINISAVMAEKGYQSHLIVSRRSGGMSAHIPTSVQVHYLKKKTFYDLKAFLRLLILVRKFKPKILHAHSTSIFWGVLIKILSGKILLVWHDHFGLSDQLDTYPRNEMKFLSRWIDKIVCVNSKLTHYWLKVLPKKREDIDTIENFPYLVLEEKVKESPFTFLHLANFRVQKNHLNLLKAVSLLASKRKDFRLILVGEFVEEEVKNQVLQAIDSLGLKELVELYGAANDVTDFLSKSGAGVLSSDSEGLPVALLEYGLAGLPVLCTDVGDCGKVISSRDFGILVPPKDPGALEQGMNQILSNPEESRSMGKRLQAKILKEYGSEGFFKKYCNLLQLE